MTLVTKPNCTNLNVELTKWVKSKFCIDLTSVGVNILRVLTKVKDSRSIEHTLST